MCFILLFSEDLEAVMCEYHWHLFGAGKYREQAGLSVLEEDTIEVVRTMRASSPPASAADLLEAQSQSQKRNNRPFRRVSTQYPQDTICHSSYFVLFPCYNTVHKLIILQYIIA